MTLTDIIILLVVILLLSLIIVFNIILPLAKKETPCSKCAYAKNCKTKNKNKEKCSKN